MKPSKLKLLAALLTFALGLLLVGSLRLLERRLERGLPSQIDPVPTVSIRDDRLEENAVYTAVIKARQKNSPEPFIIDSFTTRYKLYEDEITEHPPGDIFDGLRESLPVEKEATDDYFVKNQISSEINPGDIGYNYRLVSGDEIRTAFKNDCDAGWASLGKTYPGVAGILSFSRVGFNSKRDQAFVYSAWSCQCTCGDGGYVLLTKQNGKWLIQEWGMGWIS